MERLTTDGAAMAFALREARRGLGFVAPNPPVGCVIVSPGGEILAAGYHAKAGSDHAEVDALKKIVNPKHLVGAKMYVTLEPCAHHGRTPPCAEAIAKTPIAEVIYGVDDPNPLVSGRGLEILRRAGKVVRKTQALEGELHDLVEIFLHSMKNTSAFVALKVATTLDGKIAFTNGDSQWITSEASRLRAHELRGEYDAVLIGQRTLQVDRPRLNSRHPKFVNKKNSVIVLDPLGTCLELLKDHPLSEVGRRPEQIVVVVNKPVASDFGFQIIHCPTVQDGVFDLPVLLKELYSRGLTSVFVEGGAHTLSQFVAQYAAQRLYQFVNPSLMGHHETITWTQHLKVDSINSRPFLTKVRWEWIEDDAMVTGLLPGRERISLV